jgi:hypothetical protein
MGVRENYYIINFVRLECGMKLRKNEIIKENHWKIPVILLECFQITLILLCSAWAGNDYYVKGAPLLFHNSAQMNAIPTTLCWGCGRPFIYRILPYIIVRAIMTLRVSFYSATYFLTVISMCLFGLSFWYLLKTFTSNRWFTFIAACTVATAARFLLYYPPIFFYAYDLTVLFIFTLGLVLLARRKWIAFLVILIFATLTKETSIFLVCIFAFHYRNKLPRKQYLQNIAAQLLIYGLVRFGLMFIFRNTPGVIMQSHLRDQLLLYQIAPGAGFFYLLVFFFLLPIFLKWREKPLFLREATIILFPFLALYLIGGAPMEIRIFGECFPIIYALLVWPFDSCLSKLVRQNHEKEIAYKNRKYSSSW